MLAVRAVCFWPGLPAAWIQGLPRGLLVALVFAWTLCLLLLATFVWPQWLGTTLVRTAWLVVIVIWGSATVRNCLRLQEMLGTSLHPACEDALQLAQNDYLRGNWFEAEATLLDVLQQQPRDAEATLLLVSVLRHTKRWQPALRRLGQLVLLESAQRWAEEIEREKRLIMRAMEEAGGAEHEVQLEEHEDLSAENLAVEGVENDAYIASQFPDDQLEGVELQVSERPAEIEIRRVA